ncbi:speckle-type POZ protein B [Trichonephila inaurata madagascariensis]|uniref:Speckle-type POZ protein B n=1 Tax=Trichonephila inaurata madagascariensis TaxID=2747483 RepID=A0A8X6XPG0_9ARAC|nr:speckle-type POZ protein B [Trichonephila inaurata madagascariensis]
MDRSDWIAANKGCLTDALALEIEFVVCQNKQRSLPPEIERVCAKNDTGKPVDSLNNDMRILFKSQRFCDITLRSADGKCIKAVKAILSARSVVFTAMFETDMREKKTGVIDISDVDYETLNLLLLFLHTDTLDNIHDHKIAVKLYIAADKYQILPLKVLCSKHLSSVASPKNVFDIMYLSSKYQDEELKSAARKFISNDILNSYQWENFQLEGVDYVKAPSAKEIDCANLNKTKVISPTRNVRHRRKKRKI